MTDDENKIPFGMDEEHIKAFFSENSDVQSALGMLPWMPAMFAFLSTLAGVLALQFLYYAATAWDRPVTNGQWLTTLLVGLAVAAVVAAIARLAAGRKIRAKMRAKGILK